MKNIADCLMWNGYINISSSWYIERWLMCRAFLNVASGGMTRPHINYVTTLPFYYNLEQRGWKN